MEGRGKYTAAFMAFGTKGDVYPIAAISAAFAGDQRDYRVFFITHSAHQNLALQLEEKNVAYIPVSSPPVLSAPLGDSEGSQDSSFTMQKKMMTREHRRECLSIMDKIFGDGPSSKSDFVVINFFALEGWSLAELFQIRCVVAAPYVVPYSSAPSSFERQFRQQLPLLYKYLQEAQMDEVSWSDVIHWMWPLFTEEWGVWRSDELNLSRCPFTDPVTGLPTRHDRFPSSLLMYGFSREVVECPDYWPSRTHICGFWFLPEEWQFSCTSCRDIFMSLSSALHPKIQHDICTRHKGLQNFLKTPASMPLVFLSLSSIGSMGFLKNPQSFFDVIGAALEISNFRFLLFTAGYEPLEMVIRVAVQSSMHQGEFDEDGICLFTGRLFCFSGSIPYSWLFQRCAVVIHHGGSGSTAAALHAGIPQVLCPFMFDQFYWAERMFWLGVAPEPLKREHLLPDTNDSERILEGGTILSKAIDYALSAKVKARSREISESISSEDGVAEAVRILREKVCCPENKETKMGCQGRGNARWVSVVLVLLLVLMVQSETCSAAIYTVGDRRGWTFRIARWPKNKHFKAGDVIVFNYDAGFHNVMAVNKRGYKKCIIPQGSRMFKSGKDRIRLRRGNHYFICSYPGHCQAGMKIAITVL
ncbi:hypothetical protein V2J09_021639 [Rumex salicifolius]